MTQYYQLSTDYELADKLLKQGESIPMYQIFGEAYIIKNNAGLGNCDELKESNTKFLLPVPDPTIALQHSLTAALNECDELRVQNTKLQSDLDCHKMNAEAFAESSRDNLTDVLRLSYLVKDLQSDLDTAKNEITVANAAIVELEKEKDGLWKTIEKSEIGYKKIWELLKQAESKIEELRSRNSKLGTDLIDEMSTTAQLDQDFKEEIVLVMQRITTALGLQSFCTDYDPADYEKRIVTAIESKDQELRIAKNDIEKLDREIERLQEALECAKSIAHSRGENIDQLRSVVDQNKETFAKESKRLLAVLEDRYNKIDILEDNLERADSDRLAELTSIMRMVQALEETPQDKLSGAIYLIKRVIYEQICKLDPSQSL